MPLMAIAAGALSVGGFQVMRCSIGSETSLAQYEEPACEEETHDASGVRAVKPKQLDQWQPVAWNDDSGAAVATDAVQPRTTTPVNRPVVKVVQRPTVVQSSDSPASAAPTYTAPAVPAVPAIPAVPVNPVSPVVSAAPSSRAGAPVVSSPAPVLAPQVPQQPVVRAAKPRSMTELSVIEPKGDDSESSDVTAVEAMPAPVAAVPAVPAVPSTNAQLNAAPAPARELFAPPPIAERAATASPERTVAPPAERPAKKMLGKFNSRNSVLRLVPKDEPPVPSDDRMVVESKPEAAVVNPGVSIVLDSARPVEPPSVTASTTPNPPAVAAPPTVAAAPPTTVVPPVVTAAPRTAFTQPPLVEPAPVVASPSPLRSVQSPVTEDSSGAAMMLNERRSVAPPSVASAPVVSQPSKTQIPSRVPEAAKAPQPNNTVRLPIEPTLAPREPAVKVAPGGPTPPKPLLQMANNQARPLQNAGRQGLPPAGPMLPDKLPLANAPPARPPYMMVVARRGQEHIDYGFSLAERGATFSAEAEFTEALMLVAQAIDAAEHTRTHGEAMSIGLRAIREADDFVPRDGIEPNVTAVVATHQTPVLKRGSTQNMPILVAMQEYYTFAQYHLSIAGGHEPTAAAALYGLARLQSVLGNGNDVKKMMGGPKAIALHQAALAVDPMNYAAANELGVLLSRYGQWPEAQAAFLHSVCVSSRPENWKNLATSYEAMGDQNGARDAWRRYEIAKNERKVDAAGGGDKPFVRMVDPETFVRSSGGIEPGEFAVKAGETEVGPIQASAAMPRQQQGPQKDTVARQGQADANEKTQSDGKGLSWLKTKMSGLSGRQGTNGQQRR